MTMDKKENVACSLFGFNKFINDNITIEEQPFPSVIQKRISINLNNDFCYNQIIGIKTCEEERQELRQRISRLVSLKEKELNYCINVPHVEALEWIIDSLKDKKLNKLYSGKYIRTNYFKKFLNTNMLYREVVLKNIKNEIRYRFENEFDYNSRALSMSKKIYTRIDELLKKDENKMIKELFIIKYEV